MKAIRAEDNIRGLEFTGDLNQVNGSTATANETGIQVSGNNNLIRSNKANDNTDGFLITGNVNDIRGNEANINDEIGFDIAGSSNKLTSNQWNRSPQGGAKEKGGAEYCFGHATTLDQGGNKKDGANFSAWGAPRSTPRGATNSPGKYASPLDHPGRRTVSPAPRARPGGPTRDTDLRTTLGNTCQTICPGVL